MLPHEPFYQHESTITPEPKYTTPQDYYQPMPPNYQPELRRIADALERLVSRPAIGFSAQRMRQCLVCERDGDEMQEGFVLGRQSRHDGFWVCDDCIHRLVDTEVTRLEGS